MAQKPIPVENSKKVTNTVHKDRDWVTRVNNELGENSKWNAQWGYLQGGISNLGNTEAKNLTTQEKIKLIEQQLKEIDHVKNMTTTNSQYGNGDKLQIFEDSKYKITEGKDLRALERKLPKNWKKQKWTPPQDPFDELKNLNKKKK